MVLELTYINSFEYKLHLMTNIGLCRYSIQTKTICHTPYIFEATLSIYWGFQMGELEMREKPFNELVNQRIAFRILSHIVTF